MTALRKVLLLVVVAVVGIGAQARPNVALAYSAPTAPGTGYYIDSSWNNTVPGYSYTYAYQNGYGAVTGSPNGIVMLDFGRQTSYDSNGQTIWENVTFDGVAHETSSWTAQVVQAYMQGYQDNPQHGSATIVLGTNNSDYNWTCDNSTGNYSASWYYAGVSWGGLVNSRTVPGILTLQSGNDLESWAGTPSYGSWVACGGGAEKWYDGYESVTTAFSNVDFGSDGNAEAPSQWTVGQVYDMAWGRVTGLSYPEIYCNGQQNQWVGIRNSGYMVFNGATSENGAGSCGGSGTYTWDQSWGVFNNALVAANYTDDVDPSVAVFP